MSTAEWRVGHHNTRNIYIGDQHVAVAVGNDVAAGGIAHRIVDAVNHIERVADCDRACTNCHMCMCECP